MSVVASASNVKKMPEISEISNGTWFHALKETGFPSATPPPVAAFCESGCGAGTWFQQTNLVFSSCVFGGLPGTPGYKWG